MMWAIVSTAWLVSLIVVVYMLITASEGYEDKDGFHLGRKDEDA